jgi:filamentous hemagglutinin
VECTSEKQCQTKEVDPQEVKAALAAGTSGRRPVLAVNGIQNDLERAAELAYQNSVNDSTGQKPKAIYLMHYLPASTTVGELLVAGYEKNLASTLGYTNADQAYADAVGGADKGFFTSLGHSRGTLVQTNANDILSGRGYSNQNIEYRGVGGALSKDDYTKSAAAVIGNSANNDNIQFSYFANDLVSVLIGGNPGTLSVPEILRLMTTDNSAHSCYGTGAAGCQQVEFPGVNPGTPEKNKLLIEYVGGKLKK